MNELPKPKQKLILPLTGEDTVFGSDIKKSKSALIPLRKHIFRGNEKKLMSKKNISFETIFPGRFEK